MVWKVVAWIGACAVLLSVSACSTEAPDVAGVQPPAVARAEAAAAEPQDFAVSLDGQKLTAEHLRWMNRRDPGKDPDARTAAELANYWLEVQLLYEEAQRLGITSQTDARFVADFVTRESYVLHLIRQVREESKLSDEQMRDYYEKNKATDRQLREPARFSFSHIETKTLQESQAALDRINAGESINEVAVEFSTGLDAKKRPEPERVTSKYIERRYGKDFLDALTAASQGSVIGPIKLRKGNYGIARLDGRFEARALPFEDIRKPLKARLTGKAQRQAVQKLRNSVKQRAGDRVVKSQRILEGEKLPRRRGRGGPGARPR